ncbi:MAG: histidine phosphatase family protein [Dehalococcoidia bacterium]|nr:MAG: histidine phosphatase family protein [Dehalococcoidia bacterium]
MRLILVRHGETDSNKARLALGRADIELNEHGRWQAQRLAASLKHEPIAAIYSSPLKRALATAETIASSHGLEVQVDDGLIEMDIGEMEGLTFQQVAEQHPHFLQAWLGDQVAYEAMPGGERLLDVQERAWQVIERIRERQEHGTVAAVTHNFVILTLFCRILGLELADFRRLRHSLAAKSVLEMGGDRIIVAGFNDTCHLEADQGE